MWRNIKIIQKTIKIKGNNDNKLKIGGNDKLGFTMLLIIAASGKFLKPILITKGKTKRSLKKFDLNNEIIGTYSNNGWVNNGILKIALTLIHKITKGKKSVLLLDKYPAHKSDFITEIAKKLNINLVYVPVGKTSELQPLDISINGILKEKAKKLWKQDRINNPNKDITVKDGIKHFIKVKKDIKRKVIINSFKKSCFNEKYVI